MARCCDTKDRLIQAAYDLIWESSYGSTSVDHICERAGVRKGSFYHFFESKSHLALAALEDGWNRKVTRLNEIFSPLTPPLERFEKFAAFVLEHQVQQLERIGYVCGCPLFSLGSEVSTQDDRLRLRIEEILGQHHRYYASAILDAARQGLMDGSQPEETARMLSIYVQGTLTQARISNDLSPVRDLARGMLAILSLRPASVIPAA
ncbi:MAG: TetR family transcriptional regulator [Verrucomicrobiales bacterium]|nr:TetR family transcriptional regulator [Verrucomicrobiales bacterium]